jgi:energy-coupling factor transporter transmembrane protein EcfT
VLKRYLSAIFIFLSALTVVLGHMIDIYWSGLVAWGLGFVLLIFAVYFTKYIPNDTKKRVDNQQERTRKK